MREERPEIYKTASGIDFTIIRYLGYETFMIDIVGKRGFSCWLELKDCSEKDRPILQKIIDNSNKPTSLPADTRIITKPKKYVKRKRRTKSQAGDA